MHSYRYTKATAMLNERIERDGWVSVDEVVDSNLLDQVAAQVSSVDGDQRGGLRNLLDISAGARLLAREPGVRRVAEAVLGSQCFVVRAILFDKTPETNWKVPFHQDLTIAVKHRCEAPGFGAWSLKAGIVHVQPPIEVMQRMLAVRVHLDDCTQENGPVRVLPGSHLAGRLSAADIDAWKERIAAVDCPVLRGGVLTFRPLILHASSPATRPGHRRVVHFEFAVGELSYDLEWHTRV